VPKILTEVNSRWRRPPFWISHHLRFFGRYNIFHRD